MTSYRCHGAPVAYAIALELILVRAQELELDVSAITLSEGDSGAADEPSFWSLGFTFSKTVRSEEWQRTQTAVSYLLRPYWCEANLAGDRLALDLLRKMPGAFS